MQTTTVAQLPGIALEWSDVFEMGALSIPTDEPSVTRGVISIIRRRGAYEITLLCAPGEWQAIGKEKTKDGAINRAMALPVSVTDGTYHAIR